MMGISEKLQAVRKLVADAATQAGRDPRTVKLIAVSKTHPVSEVREALRAGQIEFGENRIQELVQKQKELPEARWHMIGTLQRNKVRQIAGFIHLIHTIDSCSLLAEVQRQATLKSRVIDCLLQINISDEIQKGGMTENEAEELLSGIKDFPQIRILGLMGMAEFTDDVATVRKQFHRLASALVRFKHYECDQIQMKELSMGMSGDFVQAIGEGATMVRIGSAIFGER